VHRLASHSATCALAALFVFLISPENIHVKADKGGQKRGLNEKQKKKTICLGFDLGILPTSDLHLRTNLGATKPEEVGGAKIHFLFKIE
jgi:hypothetical protein